MRPFRILKRPCPSFYYVEFYNPDTRKYCNRKSTETRDEYQAIYRGFQILHTSEKSEHSCFDPRTLKAAADPQIHKNMLLNSLAAENLSPEDAKRIVDLLQRKELIESAVIKNTPAAIQLVPFLLEFWDFDRSPYIKDKLLHGETIHRGHANCARTNVQKHWGPCFTGRTLGSITRKELKMFMLNLKEKGLAAATINKIMRAGMIGIHWAFQNDLIDKDITQGIVFCHDKPDER